MENFIKKILFMIFMKSKKSVVVDSAKDGNWNMEGFSSFRPYFTVFLPDEISNKVGDPKSVGLWSKSLCFIKGSRFTLQIVRWEGEVDQKNKRPTREENKFLKDGKCILIFLPKKLEKIEVYQPYHARLVFK